MKRFRRKPISPAQRMKALLAQEDSPLDITALMEGGKELSYIDGREFDRHIIVARDQRSARQEDENIKQSLLPKGSAGLYTPEMLKRFLYWEGDTCAFPYCDEPITLDAMLRNIWHLCARHNTNRLTAMYHRKRRAGIITYKEQSNGVATS